MKVILFAVIAVLVTVEGKPCGSPPCQCYQNIRRIYCVRMKLRHVPRFMAKERLTYHHLDLRWNSITNLDRNDIENFKEIDIRGNPINCSVVPRTHHIKSDCIFDNYVITPHFETLRPLTMGNSAEKQPSNDNLPTTFPVTIRDHSTTGSIGRANRRNFSEKPEMSILPTDSSVDFYVHVTLGPIGVIYVLATVAFFIHRHIKNARQRMEK